MTSETKDIALEFVDPPTSSMRTDVPRDAIFELAADIKKNGLINPITVRPKGKRFEVVAGHRRYLAHQYGGFVKIRCIVRVLNDDEAFAVMTSENLAREDVNPVDEATHVTRLCEMYGGDVGKVAEVCSRSRGWVDDRLTIGRMPADLKQFLREGKIKIGVALALNEITDDDDRNMCVSMAISQGASLVMAQYFVAQWRAGLFGSKTVGGVPDTDAPAGLRRTVMLRDAIEDKEYPADQITTIFIARKNIGYIEALRAHLALERSASVSSGGENKVVAGGA